MFQLFQPYEGSNVELAQALLLDICICGPYWELCSTSQPAAVPVQVMVTCSLELLMAGKVAG
jgi:hypothetical protein